MRSEHTQFLCISLFQSQNCPKHGGRAPGPMIPGVVTQQWTCSVTEIFQQGLPACAFMRPSEGSKLRKGGSTSTTVATPLPSGVKHCTHTHTYIHTHTHTQVRAFETWKFHMHFTVNFCIKDPLMVSCRQNSSSKRASIDGVCC